MEAASSPWVALAVPPRGVALNINNPVLRPPNLPALRAAREAEQHTTATILQQLAAELLELRGSHEREVGALRARLDAAEADNKALWARVLSAEAADEVVGAIDGASLLPGEGEERPSTAEMEERMGAMQKVLTMLLVLLLVLVLVLVLVLLVLTPSL